MDNILQVSLDGPSVNWKLYDNITMDKEQSELLGVIYVGSCCLHVPHGAFKTGFEVAGQEITKLLNGILALSSQITSKLQVSVFFYKKTIFCLILNSLNIVLEIRLIFLKFYLLIIFYLVRFNTNNKHHFLNNGERK